MPYRRDTDFFGAAVGDAVWVLVGLAIVVVLLVGCEAADAPRIVPGPGGRVITSADARWTLTLPDGGEGSSRIDYDNDFRYASTVRATSFFVGPLGFEHPSDRVTVFPLPEGFSLHALMAREVENLDYPDIAPRRLEGIDFYTLEYEGFEDNYSEFVTISDGFVIHVSVRAPRDAPATQALVTGIVEGFRARR